MAEAQEAVVEAKARLHLGFLDMNFGLGRKFGSLGLAIDQPAIRLKLSRHSMAPNVKCARAEVILERLKQQFAPGERLSIAIEHSIPSHAGLGSGTQLALAVGAAFHAIHRQEVDARAIAATLDRGARSGIGAGIFEKGGFLVDGGKGASSDPAPLVARQPFPEDWRILLVFDDALTGVHGEEERSVFATMPRGSEEMAGAFCRLTLLQILPALVEKDLKAFGDGIRAIQDGMGQLFSSFQGGSGFRSPCVREVLAWLDKQGINGSGQSSWGPTGFVFLAQNQAESVLLEAQRRFAGKGNLRFSLVRGFNRGARITVR